MPNPYQNHSVKELEAELLRAVKRIIHLEDSIRVQETKKDAIYRELRNRRDKRKSENFKNDPPTEKLTNSASPWDELLNHPSLESWQIYARKVVDKGFASILESIIRDR